MLINEKICVCTPVYNGEKFIGECISGVLAQRYNNFEYIIVDNASTDRTPEIIDRVVAGDSRVKVIRNPTTIGVIDNFITCAEHCSDDSEWIKYALADDYLYPNCLEEMLLVGQMSERVGFVSAYRLYGSQLTNVGLPPDQSVFKGADILKQQLLRKLHVCSGSPNTVMYRKSAFLDRGGFDNTYLHADTELAMRLLDKFDLGFAHCVFTKTGLHGDRQETRSIYSGLMLREYLNFGFNKLDTYKSVKFTQEEVSELAMCYAKQVNEFLAKKIAHLDYKNIRALLNSCSGNIMDKLPSAFLAAPIKPFKLLVRELYRMIRGRTG